MLKNNTIEVNFNSIIYLVVNETITRKHINDEFLFSFKFNKNVINKTLCLFLYLI